MGNDTRIISLNVRGLVEFKKCRQLFFWLRKQNIAIALLQETHSVIVQEMSWTSDRGYKIHYCNGTSDFRGVCILHAIDSCSEGRSLCVDISINHKRVTLCNLYAPNIDDESFFDRVFVKILQFDPTHIIIGGDFNLVLDIKNDKEGGR